MDKNQSELTEQIRKAIKKKLGEINAFIDDELPDYIMILVANKRSKSHMEKDLALFLGKDTANFTNWLWDLVNNIKANSKPKVSSTVVNEDDTSRKTDEDADVLNYDLNDQDGDLEPDDDNNNVLSRPINVEKSVAPPTVAKTVESVKVSKPVEEKNQQKLSGIIQQKPTGEIKSDSQKTAVKRIADSHLNFFKRKIPVKDEQDRIRNASTIASVVHISSKSVNGPALKANKLLLRAVDDATKSVLDGKTVDEYYKPTPIELLSTKTEIALNKKEIGLNKKETGLNKKEIVSNIKENSPNLVNRTFDSSFEVDSDDINKHINKVLFKDNSNDSSLTESAEFLLESPLKDSRTIYLPNRENLPTEELFFEIDPTPSVVEEKKDYPHFIVTLDGVNLSSLKRKHIDLSDESMDVDDEEGLLIEEDESCEKRQKLTERCKYWPACKNSDNCFFHHPTVPCKCFPDCKFGDKCLYIHPNCKFDALCSRKDCPFTHVKKKKFPAQQSMKPVKPRSTKIVCKFYPNCISKNCTFIHPKLCKYGKSCRLRSCHFGHFDVPSRNQLTWKASFVA